MVIDAFTNKDFIGVSLLSGTIYGDLFTNISAVVTAISGLLGIYLVYSNIKASKARRRETKREHQLKIRLLIKELENDK